MNGSKCARCGEFWAFTSGPHDNFRAITILCPMCIGSLPIVAGGKR